MTSANNKKAYVRCPWCGKQPVPTKRGRVSSHMTAGNQKCIGVGQTVALLQIHQKELAS